MSESFGDMPTATVAIHIARTFCLVPDSLPDPGDLKELADLIDSEVEDQSTGALVRGAAAYRTGRLDKAVTSLKPLAEQALYLDSPLAQLYLAMAYQRLGQEMEARQWLNSARQWATSSMQSDIPAIRVHGVAPPPRRSLPRPWYWRVEWDQLLREAERTVDN